MSVTINDRNIVLAESTRLVAATVSLSSVVNTDKVRLIVISTLSSTASSYEFRYGSTWEAGTFIATSSNSSYDWSITTPGVYTVWVVVTDIYSNSTVPVNASVTISAPGYSAINGSIVGTNIKLDWTISVTDFTIETYEVRYSNVGQTWAEATTIGIPGTTTGSILSTTFQTPAKYLGSRVWWVAAKDSLGNYSTPSSVTVTINAPSTVANVHADIVDNNVLLYWDAPTVTTTQLPIDQYEVRKGDVYATSVLVGSNANSTFSSVFEQLSGEFTYWITAIDSAGNYGTNLSLIATVNQPPDYILENDYYSSLDGTYTGYPQVLNPSSRLTNFYSDQGKVLGPVLTTETWSSHYTTNAKTTVAGFGNVLYTYPSSTTGAYEEVLDYGVVLPSTVLTTSISHLNIIGTVSHTITVSYKLNIGDSWVVAPAGQTSILLPSSSVRYVRIQVNFTSTAGDNLIQLTGLNVKLAIKQRNDSGVGTASIGGTAVTFAYPFISADTPIVQPGGSTPLIPVVVYSGGANPTGFTVKLYNLSGTDVGGPFSWVVRGY